MKDLFANIRTPWIKYCKVSSSEEYRYVDMRIRPINGEWVLYNSGRNGYSYIHFGTLEECLACYESGEFTDMDKALDKQIKNKGKK